MFGNRQSVWPANPLPPFNDAIFPNAPAHPSEDCLTHPSEDCLTHPSEDCPGVDTKT